MIKLNEYGRLIEQYSYTYMQGKPVMISYDKYKEEYKSINEPLNSEKHISVDAIGKETYLVEATTSDGKTAYDVTGKPQLYINILEDNSHDHKPDDIVVYRYDTAENKDRETYYLKFNYCGNKVANIAVNYKRIAVYDKHDKKLMVFDITDDGAIDFGRTHEKIYFKDYGIVGSTDEKVYFIDNDYNQWSYYINEDYSFIEPLQLMIYKVNGPSFGHDLNHEELLSQSISCGDQLECIAQYDADGMVRMVYETSSNCPLSMYEKATYEEGNIESMHCERSGSTIISVYPTMLTENQDNLKHQFLSLWTYDTYFKDTEGRPEHFTRRIYLLDNQKRDQLIANISCARISTTD
jgi:hypothetical protein